MNALWALILRRRPPQAEALRTWALRIAARRGKQGPSSPSPAA
jgi:prophage antirepressor-like protein